MTMGGEIFRSPPGQLQLCGWKAVIRSAFCECQTDGHWGSDLRIGEKLLAKAVLEVPLVEFRICSRRVKTLWGGEGLLNTD